MVTGPGLVDFDLSATSTRDITVRGRGGTLGWYIGEDDGLPRRLPVAPGQRDHYESGTGGHKQRLIFKRDWGQYSPDGDVRMLPTGQIVTTPLEDKYEQLARLSRHFPEAKEALQRMYAKPAQPKETVWTCACGLEFTRPFAIEIHKEACPQYQASVVPPAPVTAKPAVPITCRQCGEEFEQTVHLAQHTRRIHPKAKKRQ